MPPKVKKAPTLWQSCDLCHTIFNIKDLIPHLECCPPLDDYWSHGYIKNNVLYSFVGEIDAKGLPPHLSPEAIDDIIIMSQSAMQICNFPIGSPVLVHIDGNVVVRKVWPTTEGKLTAVRLSKESLEFGWNGQLNSNLLKVSKINGNPHLAKEIHYKVSGLEEHEKKSETLNNLIQIKTKSQIYFPGYHLKVPFYGKNLSVELVRFITFDYDDITTYFEDLSVNDKCFMTTEKTEFKLIDQALNDSIIEGSLEKEIVIGGYMSIIDELKTNIFSTLKSNSPASKENLSYGVILYGIHGTGKTLISQFLAQISKVPVIEVQSMELFSKYYGETERRLRQLFKTAIRQSPCILILDNIEVLCPKKGSDQERRVIATLLSLFDMIRNKKMVILATSSKLDEIDSALRRPGRLESEVEIHIPTSTDRLGILEALVPDEKLKPSLQMLADLTHGFVAADLTSIVTKAVCKATVNERQYLTKEDLFWAHSQVKPSAMREVYVHVPNVKWSDIGGQDELKLKLQQSVEWPIKYPDSFKRLGIKPPKGVLLYGPPGCSKTLIAKALATESKLNFLSVKGSDIFSKWVGESERAMRDLFKRARSVAPAIIFLDEIDALGGEREVSASGGSAVQERVLSQLLTEMDGVQPLDNVIIIAATNRPDRMDKALLRPGRLDRLLYVPLPSFKTRLQIFKLQLKRMPVNVSVDVKNLTKQTEGYSGAEVVAVCNEAALKALEDNIEATDVKIQHFEAALKIVTPRTPQSLIQLYDDYINRHNKS